MAVVDKRLPGRTAAALHCAERDVVGDDVTRDTEWRGRTGLVYECFDDGTVERALEHPLDPARVSAFLCGNPAMIQGMQEILGAKGFAVHARKSPGSIFVEEYW